MTTDTFSTFKTHQSEFQLEIRPWEVIASPVACETSFIILSFQSLIDQIANFSGFAAKF